jgi:hypothetical protein
VIGGWKRVLPTRVGRPLLQLIVLISVCLTGACASHQGASPVVPSTSLPETVHQYLHGAGADALRVDSVTASVLSGPGTVSCRAAIEDLGQLGSPENVAGSIGGIPDQHLSELAADEFSSLIGVLTVCQVRAPSSASMKKLRLVYDSVSERLRADGPAS